MTDQNQPGQQPAYPVPQGYPQQQPAYPVPQGYPQQAYPGQQPAYPQQYPQQPMYTNQVYVNAYGPPQPKGLSVTSLVLGLVSVFFGFTVLVPIGAVIFGILGMKREPTAKGMSITGLVLGSLNLLGWAAFWVIMIFVWIAALGTVASYSTTY